MRIYVGGTFDLFHGGHVRLLKRASRLGEVWVSLNTDEFATQYKRKPILSLNERLEVVSACEFVSQVVVNEGGADSKPAILKVDPDYIVHGDDWVGDSFLEQLGVTNDWLHMQGIGLVFLPYTDGISSGEIERRVREHGYVVTGNAATNIVYPTFTGEGWKVTSGGWEAS